MHAQSNLSHLIRHKPAGPHTGSAMLAHRTHAQPFLCDLLDIFQVTISEEDRARRGTFLFLSVSGFGTLRLLFADMSFRQVFFGGISKFFDLVGFIINFTILTLFLYP